MLLMQKRLSLLVIMTIVTFNQNFYSCRNLEQRYEQPQSADSRLMSFKKALHLSNKSSTGAQSLSATYAHMYGSASSPALHWMCPEAYAMT